MFCRKLFGSKLIIKNIMQNSSLFTITTHHLKSSSKDSQKNEAAVILEEYPHATNVVLNKPKSLNALDPDIIKILQSAILKWNSNPNLKVVIFSGNGGKAFCAGGDVKKIYLSKIDPSLAQFPEQILVGSFKLYYDIATMKPIQVAIWNGTVIGGGVGISLNAPIKISTDNTVFSMPEARIGLHLGIGGGYHFSRMKKGLGYFLGLTGYRLNGIELVQCKIADYFVKGENQAKLTHNIIESSHNDMSIEEVRAIVKKYSESIDSVFPYEELINRIFTKPSLEEIFLGLEQEKGGSKDFAHQLLQMMNSYSPMCMKVIFEQIRKGEHLNFKESLEMDIMMTKKLVDGVDFQEGVRTLLVERNSNPNWQYKSIYEIKDEDVQKYFTKLDNDYVSKIPKD